MDSQPGASWDAEGEISLAGILQLEAFRPTVAAIIAMLAQYIF